MYTAAGLLDIHQRTHRSLGSLLDACERLPSADLLRPLEGFSYPTIAAQLHHVLGAERYWFGVLRGELLTDDDAEAHPSVDALRALRVVVAEATTTYLRAQDDAALSAPCAVRKWTGEQVEVVPAHVLLRTQTHAYQHQGEISAMVRLLGHSFPPGLDFPLA